MRLAFLLFSITIITSGYSLASQDKNCIVYKQKESYKLDKTDKVDLSKINALQAIKDSGCKIIDLEDIYNKYYAPNEVLEKQNFTSNLYYDEAKSFDTDNLPELSAITNYKYLSHSAITASERSLDRIISNMKKGAFILSFNSSKSKFNNSNSLEYITLTKMNQSSCVSYKWRNNSPNYKIITCGYDTANQFLADNRRIYLSSSSQYTSGVDANCVGGSILFPGGLLGNSNRSCVIKDRKYKINLELTNQIKTSIKQMLN